MYAKIVHHVLINSVSVVELMIVAQTIVQFVQTELLVHLVYKVTSFSIQLPVFKIVKLCIIGVPHAIQL